MSLLYLLACIIAILIIIALLFFLIPDIRSGAWGTAEQTFEPSRYEKLVEPQGYPCADPEKEIGRFM